MPRPDLLFIDERVLSWGSLLFSSFDKLRTNPEPVEGFGLAGGY